MIIITGASSGVGKFLFEYFIYNNLSIRGIYNNTNPQDNLENYYKLNILDIQQINKFIFDNQNYLNNIILINCAGITYNSFTHKSDQEMWKKVVETNLFGTYNMIRSFLPLMRQDKFGRIINFSSVVAEIPTPGVSAYAASKSALWGMSKSIAKENASLNITINNINLGYSTLGMIKDVPADFLNDIIKKIPANRLCEPESIINTVEYIIKTSYLNGTSINLSGGMV